VVAAGAPRGRRARGTGRAEAGAPAAWRAKTGRRRRGRSGDWWPRAGNVDVDGGRTPAGPVGTRSLGTVARAARVAGMGRAATAGMRARPWTGTAGESGPPRTITGTRVSVRADRRVRPAAAVWPGETRWGVAPVRFGGPRGPAADGRWTAARHRGLVGGAGRGASRHGVPGVLTAGRWDGRRRRRRRRPRWGAMGTGRAATGARRHSRRPRRAAGAGSAVARSVVAGIAVVRAGHRFTGRRAAEVAVDEGKGGRAEPVRAGRRPGDIQARRRTGVPRGRIPVVGVDVGVAPHDFVRTARPWAQLSRSGPISAKSTETPPIGDGHTANDVSVGWSPVPCPRHSRTSVLSNVGALERRALERRGTSSWRGNGQR